MCTKLLAFTNHPLNILIKSLETKIENCEPQLSTSKSQSSIQVPKSLKEYLRGSKLNDKSLM